MFPTLFHLGHLTLPTFAALAALGLIAALLLSERAAALAAIPPAKLWDTGIFAVLAAFILSRLLLAITFWQSFRANPLLLLPVPALTPIGIILTLVATTVWLYFHRIPILRALDAWSPCATLVWSALALGHFAEASDPGTPTTLPWALPLFLGDHAHLHPVALYAALAAACLTLASYRLLAFWGPPTRKDSGNEFRHPDPEQGEGEGPLYFGNPGTTAAATLVASGLTQFFLSFVRQPPMDSLFGLDPLQLNSLALIVVGCALLLRTLLVPVRQ
jgi:phosphatidylglycerol:prolipoprotein diacylglycerol transferase